MQNTATRFGGSDMSWARAAILATGFFFISVIYLGQIPSFFSLVFTQANLHTMSQSMLSLGLLTLGIALISITISFLYDPKPLSRLFPPLFGLVGLGIAGVGAAAILFEFLTGHEYFPDQTIQHTSSGTQTINWPFPDHGWFLSPNWFQPQSVDIGSVGFVLLMVGGGILSYALLYYPWSRGQLTPARTNLIARICAVVAGAFVLAYITVYTFSPAATSRNFYAGAAENALLTVALMVALFGLQVWLLPVMTAPGNRQKFMPNIYLHGVMLLGNVAVPLLGLFVIVYPVVTLLHSISPTDSYFVQCSLKTDIPNSCTFTANMGYIVAAVVAGMLFTFMIAAGYLWSRKSGFVKLGSTFAFVFAALAVVATHATTYLSVNGTPIALSLAVGIVIMGLIWTVATEREFVPVAERNVALGCTGQWLVWGSLLFAYLGAFAFFSYPVFLDTEQNLIVVQGAHTLHDAYWVMLLMGGLTAIHFAFLMRRAAIGNVRKFALWGNIVAMGLLVTAAITLTPQNGLGVGSPGDNYSSIIYWAGVIVELLGIAAALYGGVVTGGIPWLLAILVPVIIGVVGVGLVLVSGNALPDVLVAFTILGGVGAIFYSIYGKDAPSPTLGNAQARRTAALPTAEPGLPE